MPRASTLSTASPSKVVPTKVNSGGVDPKSPTPLASGVTDAAKPAETACHFIMYNWAKDVMRMNAHQFNRFVSFTNIVQVLVLLAKLRVGMNLSTTNSVSTYVRDAFSETNLTTRPIKNINAHIAAIMALSRKDVLQLCDLHLSEVWNWATADPTKTTTVVARYKMTLITHSYKRYMGQSREEEEEEEEEEKGEEKGEELGLATIATMRAPELRAALDKRGLLTTGVKAELVARLEQALCLKWALDFDAEKGLKKREWKKRYNAMRVIFVAARGAAAGLNTIELHPIPEENKVAAQLQAQHDTAAQKEVEEVLLRIFKKMKTAETLHTLSDPPNDAEWICQFRAPKMSNALIAYGCTRLLYTANLHERQVVIAFPYPINTSGNVIKLDAGKLAESMVAACYWTIVALIPFPKKSGWKDTKMLANRYMDREGPDGGTGYKDVLLRRNIEVTSIRGFTPLMVKVLQEIGVLTIEDEQRRRTRRFDAIVPELTNTLFRGRESQAVSPTKCTQCGYHLLPDATPATCDICDAIAYFRLMIYDSFIEVKTSDAGSNASSKDIALANHHHYATEALFSVNRVVLCSDRERDPGWASRLFNTKLWSDLRHVGREADTGIALLYAETDANGFDPRSTEVNKRIADRIFTKTMFGRTPRDPPVTIATGTAALPPLPPLRF
jgi:hypothetical protein